MKKQKSKREFNDLLLPILLILAVLPFVTRLIIYSSGLSKYPWFSDCDVITDFFTYYKSIAFIVISMISTVILILYCILQRSQLKSWKPLIPLGIYSLFVTLSTILSVDLHSSIVGGIGHFESILVLLGYVVMLIYAYQIEKKEEDYRTILRVFATSVILICVIGLFQMIGKDLLTMEWFQKLIIPREYWGDYIGKLRTYLSSNAVSLTLFNPNFAAVYLAMIIPFLLVFILPSRGEVKQKLPYILSYKEHIFGSVIIIILTMLLFKTYSRTGLVSVIITLLLIGYYYRKQVLCSWKKLCIIGISGILVFVAVDYVNEFRYMEKIIGTIQSFQNEEDRHSLEEILTNNDNISIRYQGDLITIAFAEDTDKELIFKNEAGEDITKNYNYSSKTLSWKQYESVQFSIEIIEDKRYIICVIEDDIWRFYINKQEGYFYLNDFGKIDKLTTIDHIGFKNTENIGSGRGFIWSRSIPLLKDVVLLGKGPDTFPIVFPQSDYVGKANNCKTPYTLIEKPHSLYLMIGIQSGLISLFAFLGFYMLYLINSLRIFKNNSLNSLRDRMGLACLLATLSFMISGFFNDSSLQTTPIFFVLLGLGMDINHKIQKSK